MLKGVGGSITLGKLARDTGLTRKYSLCFKHVGGILRVVEKICREKSGPEERNGLRRAFRLQDFLANIKNVLALVEYSTPKICRC